MFFVVVVVVVVVAVVVVVVVYSKSPNVSPFPASFPISGSITAGSTSTSGVMMTLGGANGKTFCFFAVGCSTGCWASSSFLRASLSRSMSRSAKDFLEGEGPFGFAFADDPRLKKMR